MRRWSLFAALILITACGSDPPSSLLDGVDTGDVASFDTQDGAGPETDGSDDASTDAGVSDDTSDEDIAVDTDADAAVDAADCETLGCACDDDLDCASGYCLDTADGSRVCSELCDGTCSEPGYTCRDLVNAAGDVVRLCVADRDILCQPCEVPTDCGRLDAACAPLEDGESACLPACDDAGLCPIGSTCESLEGADGAFCVPDAGICDGCIDRDDDGYGIGTNCLGLDHDDLDPSSYEGAPELCDGVDNDGDGVTDEDFDLTSDPNRCGACDIVCAVDGGTVACVEGACVIETCPDGRGDCDADYATGCEVDLFAGPLCGACEAPDDALGSACGVCDSGVFVCTDGGVLCDGDEGEAARNPCGGCVELDDDPGDPCGTCGGGTLACDGADALTCVDGDRLNACGGCALLAGAPGEACGACDSGRWACDGTEAVTCAGDAGDAARNACGGCGPLRAEVGDACGTCDSGVWACGGPETLTCAGDDGADALNACGGCGVLRTEPGTACGTCDLNRYVCDGTDATVCDGDDTSCVCVDTEVSDRARPWARYHEAARGFDRGGRVTFADRDLYIETLPAHHLDRVGDTSLLMLNTFIANIYRRNFNRSPDREGLAYWVDDFAAGLTFGELRTLILAAASEESTVRVESRCEEPLTFACAPRREVQATAPWAVCTRGDVYYVNRAGAGRTTSTRPGTASYYAYTDRPDVRVRDRTWEAVNEHIAAIYRDVIGRTPDCEGLAYWGGEFAAGRLDWDDLRPTIEAASTEPEVDFVLDECGGTL